MQRELILDDVFPPALADELNARGRPARHVSSGSDAELLAGDGVLVTTTELPGAAVIAARTDAARRDAVHRHAHAIAAQSRGRTQTYR